MKKSKVKWEIHRAMRIYYDKGLTSTASAVERHLFKSIDKLYNK